MTCPMRDDDNLRLTRRVRRWNYITALAITAAVVAAFWFALVAGSKV